MSRYRFGRADTRRAAMLVRVVAICAFVVPFALLARPADAATHQVASGVSDVDCRSFNGGVQPGDTLVLSGRSRGAVRFSNCVGTSSAPIVIRNDVSQSGPLVVTMTGNGFQTQCLDCQYVTIDGTGKWAGAPSGECGASNDDGDWKLGRTNCGIVMRCTSGSPNSGIRIGGSSRHVTVKGVEIDGNTPACGTRIGLSVNDHDYKGNASEWREGIKLLNNYVHDVEGEGMYVGPNQTKTSVGDLQLRNNEIANNLVDRTGCDGINYKSAIAGSSSIHHNYVLNTGQSPRGIDSGCSGSGISLFEAGFTDVYSNYVEAPSPNSSGPGNCISQIVSNLSSGIVPTVPVRIYNNVTRNCKGNGISASRRDQSVAAPVVTVYNNTVVPPIGGTGIAVASSIGSCEVRDNIVAGKVVNANQCSVSNNSTDDVSTQRFYDAEDRDFRLTAGSPAVDIGGNECPRVDHVGTPRPQQGECDQGAFEFVTGNASDATKPRPPASVLVE